MQTVITIIAFAINKRLWIYTKVFFVIDLFYSVKYNSIDDGLIKKGGEMKTRKIVFMLVTIILLLGIVFGDTLKNTIDVFYRDIKIVVDNNQVELGLDSTGKNIEPFIYNGTTYLPVRAVSEALGKEVSWDGKTSTVYIGRKQDEKGTIVKLNEDLHIMHYGGLTMKNRKGGEQVSDIAGEKYDYYIYPYAQTFTYIEYPLKNEFDTFECQLGWMKDYSYNNKNATIKIYLDGKHIKTYVDVAGDFTKKISVSVKGARKLRIEFNGSEGATLFNPILIK